MSQAPLDAMATSWYIGAMEKARATISQTLCDLTVQILSNHMLLLHENYWWNQASILHMPRQLSCRGMYKIVTWLSD